jgi:GDP-4-dehydro-6-deoxy-D-mannose reductase
MGAEANDARTQMLSTLPFARILITGADGFVGSHLLPEIAQLCQEDARLLIATRTPAANAAFEEIEFDLLDASTINRAVAQARPDLVVHLAAQSSVDQSRDSAWETWQVNLGGSLALARAIASHAPSATLFFVSSAEVYGATFNEAVAHEGSPLRPRSAYARSKAACEAMFGDILPDDMGQLIIVRPSNHSGSGQDSRFVIPAFASQIARIEAGLAPADIKVGNLDAERDFMDVRDVVRAYIMLLASAGTLARRAIFNIGSERIVRIGSLLDRLRTLSEVPTRVVVDPKRMRPSEIPRAAVDATAIREAIDWEPRYSLDDLLETVLAAERLRAVGTR